MKYSIISLCFVGFLLFLGNLQLGFGEEHGSARNYITWDDLEVDGDQFRRLNMRDGYNRSRVIVVDKNGDADSITVQGAVDMVPVHNTRRVKIFIRPGIYREKVFVPNSKSYISFIGNKNRISDTVITWNSKASDKDNHGPELGTYRSASIAIESDYFCATGITFENTVVAKPGEYGMQGVALRIAGHKAMFYKVRFVGAQDTLLDDTGTHYFYQCHIQGTVDFIFGHATSLYQDCIIESKAEGAGAIAAHHRDSSDDDSGFSFVNCKINGTGDVYLGRAWGNYSRVIYSYCDIADIITPKGWSDWNDPSRQKTVEVGQFECRGKGAETSHRVKWSKCFSYDEVSRFLDKKYILGDQWLRL